MSTAEEFASRYKRERDHYTAQAETLALNLRKRTTEVREVREEVQACLEFLANELQWEYFRAEMLYHDDAEHERQSLQNAQAIKNFLVSRGWKCGEDGRAIRISSEEGGHD